MLGDVDHNKTTLAYALEEYDRGTPIDYDSLHFYQDSLMRFDEKEWSNAPWLSIRDKFGNLNIDPIVNGSKTPSMLKKHRMKRDNIRKHKRKRRK